MKNKIKTAVLATSLLLGFSGMAQQISLHTGRINTPLNPATDNVSPQPLPLSQTIYETDDTWMVKLPVGPFPQGAFYQAAYITNGIMSPGGGSYPGQDISVRWIAPARNSAGEHLDNQPVGNYLYRMTFILNECQVAGCKNAANPPVIVFNHIGGDNVIDQVTVNSSNYAVNLPYNPFTSINIPLSVNDLQVGSNQIILRVNNLHNWTGLEINGYLELNSLPDFTITDKNGNPKLTFCFLEEVILDPGITTTTAFNIKVFKGTQLVATDAGSGDMGTYKVSDLLRAGNPLIITPGIYTVEYYIWTACGEFKRTTVPFEFTCCDETNDPSFNVMLNEFGMLTATPVGYGNHSWTIYSTPSAHTGPYTSVQNLEGPTLEFQGIEGQCYHVKHTVVSACGTFCDAQTVCMSTCDLEECILPQPTAWYNAVTGAINWLPVTGAIKYIVVMTTNDPACCPLGGGDQVSNSTIQQYEVTGTSYPVVPPAPEGNQLLLCYSYRVYAICEDGTPSPSSQVICFNLTHGRQSGMGITSTVDGVMTVSQIELFPNPASGQVTLTCSSSKAMIAEVSILSATGSKLKVLEGKLLSSSEPLEIDIRDLKPGIYLLNVNADGSQVKFKLIVE